MPSWKNLSRFFWFLMSVMLGGSIAGAINHFKLICILQFTTAFSNFLAYKFCARMHEYETRSKQTGRP